MANPGAKRVVSRGIRKRRRACGAGRVALLSFATQREGNWGAPEMSANPAILNVCATQHIDLNALHHEAATARRRRAAAMAEMYTGGKTYAEIGRMYGVSTERVRQILSKMGISGIDGGRSICNAKRRAERAAITNARYMANKGCTREQWLQVPRKIRHQCLRKRGQVRHEYGAQAWAMTLWEYYTEVKQVGVEVSRGGLCMTRIDRNRPFAPGNVKFARAGSWSKRRPKES